MKKRFVLALAIAVIVPLAMTGCGKKETEEVAKDAAATDAAAKDAPAKTE